MAIKQEIFNEYIKEREVTKLKKILNTKVKYSHNRVFDEPDYLKQETNPSLDQWHHLEANNSRQSAHKLETQLNTNGAQTVDNKYEIATKNEITVDKWNTKLNTNGAQTVDKNYKNPTLTNLVGLQRKLILIMYQNCRTYGGKVTQEMTVEHLAQLTKCNKNSVKTTVLRLKRKNCIYLSEYKDGRSGWSKYEINNHLYTDILQQENLIFQNTFGRQTVDKVDSELNTEPNTSSSSSSSNSIILSTTTELPHDWLKIDLSSLQHAFTCLNLPNKQYFGKSQLKLIFNATGNKLTAGEIQESINQFAYCLSKHALEDPYQSMKNPAAVLFEYLKNGDVWTDPRFLTEHEQQLKRIYDNIFSKLQKEVKEHFKKWLEIDKQEKYDLYKQKLPSNYYYGENEFLDLAWKDFLENIWPLQRTSIILEFIGSDNKMIAQKFDKLREFQSNANKR